MVKAYAKSPMALKQFGINLADITKVGKQAQKDQTAHTKSLKGMETETAMSVAPNRCSGV